MQKVKVKIICEKPCLKPFYAKKGDAGMDLRANLEEAITLKPLERRLIPTGIKIGLPDGYEAQIRPRSGEALKRGLTVLNTPGTIDSGYTGEVGIILINLSYEEKTIEPLERVAQMVINKFETAEFKEVDSLDQTERGEGGFGHTGK